VLVLGVSGMLAVLRVLPTRLFGDGSAVRLACYYSLLLPPKLREQVICGVDENTDSLVGCLR
jgi:hypothetical protein